MFYKICFALLLFTGIPYIRLNNLSTLLDEEIQFRF